MMGVRGPQQEVGPVLLLPLLLLLLLGISVVGNTCGCWGTNQVYVHYKPPVSGWFLLSPKRKFVYERAYNVYTAEPQTHRFVLRYMVTKEIWLLLERKKRGWERLSRSTRNSSGPITVSCPTGQCSCRIVEVLGSSCWSINGQYTKYSDKGEPLQNHNTTQPQDSKGRRSQCLLTQLVECLSKTKNDRSTDDVCHQYTKPLISNKTLVHKQEHYIHHKYSYILTKAPKHDFWLIESENKVHAISRNTGPCPDQLTPDPRTWVRTGHNFIENITVTCTSWDSPSGD